MLFLPNKLRKRQNSCDASTEYRAEYRSSKMVLLFLRNIQMTDWRPVRNL